MITFPEIHCITIDTLPCMTTNAESIYYTIVSSWKIYLHSSTLAFLYKITYRTCVLHHLSVVHTLKNRLRTPPYDVLRSTVWTIKYFLWNMRLTFLSLKYYFTYGNSFHLTHVPTNSSKCDYILGTVSSLIFSPTVYNSTTSRYWNHHSYSAKSIHRLEWHCCINYKKRADGW